MAKSRSTPPATPRPFVRRLDLAHGNGSPVPETDTQRFDLLEGLLVRIQETLETQFKRMADMQVLIDRLTADRDR
jgi:hypothetical protein